MSRSRYQRVRTTPFLTPVGRQEIQLVMVEQQATQTSLVEKMGMKQTTLSGQLSGRAAMPPSTRENLYNALGQDERLAFLTDAPETPYFTYSRDDIDRGTYAVSGQGPSGCSDNDPALSASSFSPSSPSSPIFSPPLQPYFTKINELYQCLPAVDDQLRFMRGLDKLVVRLEGEIKRK